MTVLQSALALAAQGLPVFPCMSVPGNKTLDKSPTCEGGFKAATTDPERVRALFANQAAKLIGVPTGATSGLDALDLDPRNGSDAWLAANQHILPVTRVHATRSGGEHFIFRHEPGLRCSTGRPGSPRAGVDIKADGGYIIWWPSAGCPVPMEEEPAPWPARLLTALNETPAPLASAPASGSPPPSIQAVADLLNDLPNPAHVGYDDYTAVMLGASGCIAALGGDGPDEEIKEAAIAWAERWEGAPAGERVDEREKWESDWSKRTDRPLAAWNTLRRYAQRLVPGYRESGDEFPEIPPGPPEPVRLTEISEDEAARKFAVESHRRFKFDHSSGQWFEFITDGWDHDLKASTVDAARRFLTEKRELWGIEQKETLKAASAAFIHNTVRLAQSDPLMATMSAEWDTDPFMLGVPGGCVDLRTGEIHPAAPMRLMRRRTTVAPRRGPHPVWGKFLHEATGGDPELARWLQRWAGYVLTGDVSEEMFAFIYGPGKNGKGVFTGAIEKILGNYVVNIPAKIFDAANNKPVEYYVAQWTGARLLKATETEAGSIMAESFVKEMTGNEGEVSARPIRGAPFTYRSQAKILIVGNHAPKLNGRSDAMERRLRVVPFNHRPPVQDPTLKDRLAEEYPQILAWMIDGCVAWQRERLGVCSAIKAASSAYFDEQDTLMQWVSERCDTSDPKARGSASRLLDDFNAWLRSRGDKPMHARDFKEALDQRMSHIAYRRDKLGSIYLGISLSADADGMLPVTA